MAAVTSSSNTTTKDNNTNAKLSFIRSKKTTKIQRARNLNIRNLMKNLKNTKINASLCIEKWKSYRNKFIFSP